MRLRRWWMGASLALGLAAGAAAEEAAPTAPPATPTWADLMRELEPIGDAAADKLLDPKDPQARQDLFRFLHEMMSQAFFSLQYQDPRYPDFWPMFNQVYPYGFANPDDAYYQAAIEDGGVYRISGVRGSTRIVDFEVGSGDFVPYGKGRLGPTLAHYDLDRDVKLGKDGHFETILSAERPANWKGDWWKLGKGATFLWVRQRSYDWAKDVDGRFAIERVDLPAARPRDTSDRVAAGLRQLPKWTAAWAEWRYQWLRRLQDKGLVNKVEAQDLSDSGGIANQRYLQGIFDLQPDEALVLVTEIPRECRYWGFQLTDEMTNTLDWVNRQTSLNGLTTRRDADGKVRVVISARDPGVPNWLDVVEHQRGMIVGRWKECSSYPAPAITKVKVADVRQALPADTPAVSAEARDASIRARREAAQMRRRW